MIGVAAASPAMKVAAGTISSNVFNSHRVGADVVNAEIAEALKQAGVPIVPDAEAVMTGDIRAESCLHAINLRTCEVTVGWTLRFKDGGEPAYRVVTRGIGQDHGTGAESLTEALRDSAARLAARPNFQAAKQPEPTVAPTPDWKGTIQIKRCTTALALPTQITAAMDASVLIRSGGGIGSGVQISPDGWLLTAAHVVGNAKEVTIESHTGVQEKAAVVRVDYDQDVALLRSNSRGVPCVPVATTTTPAGTEIFAIGSPLGAGLSFSVSKGIVSGERSADGLKFLQTDVTLNAGNSGGPLLTPTGTVAGIVSWKVAGGGVEGIGFGVPTEMALSRLRIEPAEVSTDSALLETAGSATPVSRNIDDSPDPSRLKRAPHSVTVGNVIGSGLIVLGGAGAVGASMVLYDDKYGRRDTTEEDWGMLKGINVAGYAVSGVGLGTLAIPFIINADTSPLTVRFQ